MPFARNFNTFIQKNNKNILIRILNDRINLENYNSNFDLISSTELLTGNYSFTDVWFDLNEDENIYGIVNSPPNGLTHFHINDKVVIKSNLLKYEFSKFTIKFLYIKKIGKQYNIIFYLLNNSDTNKCTLIHYYKNNGPWIKSTIDTIQYSILTNFVAICDDSLITIFYLNQVNGYEEVFTTTFDSENKTWSTPLQLTNTHKAKVYLSAIKFPDCSYHITYSENNFNKYYCSYINVSNLENSFTNSINKIISETVACTFPSIIFHNKILYIQWIEYNSLYYCISYDLGNTWTKPILDDTSSDYDFYCYSYKTNNLNKNDFSLPIIFACHSPTSILGINHKNIF